jgi:hypothetical protein
MHIPLFTDAYLARLGAADRQARPIVEQAITDLSAERAILVLEEALRALVRITGLHPFLLEHSICAYSACAPSVRVRALTNDVAARIAGAEAGAPPQVA